MNQEHLRFILKCPTGYFTPYGVTPDITCKDIIIFNIFGIKLFPIDGNFSILCYSCPVKGYYNCADCPHMEYCDFLNNRSKIDFYETDLL